MRAMRMAGLGMLVFALSAGAFPPLPKAKEKKAGAKELAKALQGTWEVTTLERGGGMAPIPDFKMFFTFHGEKLARSAKQQGMEMKGAASTIKLDASKSPAWLDATTGSGATTRPLMTGIVKVDGDKMIWVYATAKGERPTKLDGELARAHHRYTLKRVKK